MRVIRHEPIDRERNAYRSHPHMVAAADGNWLLAFNRSVRRPVVLHPPHDPEYCNLLIISHDEERSWGEPSPVPREGIRGVECPGMTTTRNGRILLNQWRFQWHAWSGARHRGSAKRLTSPETLVRTVARQGDAAGRKPPMDLLESVITCARGDGELSVHISDDGGRTFPGRTASKRARSAEATECAEQSSSRMAVSSCPFQTRPATAPCFTSVLPTTERIGSHRRSSPRSPGRNSRSRRDCCSRTIAFSSCERTGQGYSTAR